METKTESPPRDFDIVLFGATGFTGRLVAERIAEHAASMGTLRWALAGRNPDKLAAVRDAVAAKFPGCAQLPLLTVDASDGAGLRAVARRTHVVCTTVGPYLRLGLPLATACAEEGTDYCDLTGEVQFMHENIARTQARAVQTGARIVHTCGFDSIPSDMGVRVLHDALAKQGKQLAAARLYVRSIKGGMSGGTLASILTLLEQAASDRNVRRMLADPLALVPKNEGDSDQSRAQRRSALRDPKKLSFDTEARQWTIPFFMGVVNSRVVHRSNALLGHPYGRDFRYAEYVGLGAGPRGAVLGAAMMGGLGGFLLLGLNGVTRGWVSRLLPEAGTGPSPDVVQRGRWHLQIRGYVADMPQAAAVLSVRGQGDPGYGSTSRMLTEVALLLAETAHTTDKVGGIQTPASALGMPLVPRLARAGVTFELQTP